MYKKTLIAAVLSMLITTCANALPSMQIDYDVDVTNDSGITMDTLWNRTGKYEEKVITIGSKLLYDNNINKRVPFVVDRSKELNARSSLCYKVVSINKGLLPYIDNDDEMAFIIGHEIAHSLDAYGGYFKWIAMNFRSKHYEYKSDLASIDLMVKSGYNPVAAITCANKWMPEEQYDLFSTHPKTSKRLMEIYKYISVNYPWALKSSMTSNIHYINFKRSMDRDIKDFEYKTAQKELKKQQKTKSKSKI